MIPTLKEIKYLLEFVPSYRFIEGSNNTYGLYMGVLGFVIKLLPVKKFRKEFYNIMISLASCKHKLWLGLYKKWYKSRGLKPPRLKPDYGDISRTLYFDYNKIDIRKVK